jgi:hypothetical protein
MVESSSTLGDTRCVLIRGNGRRLETTLEKLHEDAEAGRLLDSDALEVGGSKTPIRGQFGFARVVPTEDERLIWRSLRALRLFWLLVVLPFLALMGWLLATNRAEDFSKDLGTALTFGLGFSFPIPILLWQRGQLRKERVGGPEAAPLPSAKPPLPRMTGLLIGFIVASFVVQWVVPEYGDHLARDSNAIRAGQVWRLATYMLIHNGLPHLILNMLLLSWEGRALEPLVGPRPFLGLFFLGGIAGAVVNTLLGGETSGSS